jgi:hypothetical protein
MKPVAKAIKEDLNTVGTHEAQDLLQRLLEANVAEVETHNPMPMFGQDWFREVIVELLKQ